MPFPEGRGERAGRRRHDGGGDAVSGTRYMVTASIAAGRCRVANRRRYVKMGHRVDGGESTRGHWNRKFEERVGNANILRLVAGISPIAMFSLTDAYLF